MKLTRELKSQLEKIKKGHYVYRGYTIKKERETDRPCHFNDTTRLGSRVAWKAYCPKGQRFMHYAIFKTLNQLASRIDDEQA